MFFASICNMKLHAHKNVCSLMSHWHWQSELFTFPLAAINPYSHIMKAPHWTGCIPETERGGGSCSRSFIACIAMSTHNFFKLWNLLMGELAYFSLRLPLTGVGTLCSCLWIWGFSSGAWQSLWWKFECDPWMAGRGYGVAGLYGGNFVANLRENMWVSFMFIPHLL